MDGSGSTSETPDSDSRTSHSYTTSSKSPTLQAFYSFEEALAQFLCHVLTKYDLRLDEAIKLYEAKKPTDLAADASSVTLPDKPERNRSSLFKGNQTIKEMFDVLNHSIVKLRTAIGKKVHKSMYEDYSCSMDKKLKNLKLMCVSMNKELERNEEDIKQAIEENNTFNDG